MLKLDMHCHSTCSDGTMTPLDLLDEAIKEGLAGLSITDHDTIEAYTPEVIKRAKELNLILYPGVEFSCEFNKFHVHVLGYGFDIHSPELITFCKRHQENRGERNQAIVNNLNSLGYELTLADVEKNCEGVCGRPHIAKALVDKGYFSDIRTVFLQVLADDKPGYASGPSYSVQETLDVIHKAGGKAFLAHPHMIRRNHLIRRLLEMPFDGIECYYSKMPLSRERPFLDRARSYCLAISGGSDFHGAVKPDVPLGASWISKKEFLSWADTSNL